jgi:hypothetical protein
VLDTPAPPVYVVLAVRYTGYVVVVETFRYFTQVPIELNEVFEKEVSLQLLVLSPIADVVEILIFISVHVVGSLENCI